MLTNLFWQLQILNIFIKRKSEGGFLKKIVITGGCGYVGSSLIPSLLNDPENYRVVVIDTQWFGNHLKEHDRLEVVKGDYRDHLELFNDCFCIIHLANVANDPAVELNPALSWEINVLGTQMLLDHCARNGVLERFLYASSGSVYGIKSEERVTEDLSLIPLSVYNKTKMCAERVCLSYSDRFMIANIRPATVCGFSPRMRLDVAVNMFVFQAFENKRITLFGGEQSRPNITIGDMVNVYRFFLKLEQFESGAYNAGFENIVLADLANSISAKTGCEIVRTESNDPRSYRLDSSKISELGFRPLHTVENAIEELLAKFASGELVDDCRWHTVSMMKEIGL